MEHLGQQLKRLFGGPRVDGLALATCPLALTVLVEEGCLDIAGHNSLLGASSPPASSRSRGTIRSPDLDDSSPWCFATREARDIAAALARRNCHGPGLRTAQLTASGHMPEENAPTECAKDSAMSAISKKPSRTRRPAPIALPTREPTNDERRDRWRREAGTAPWPDETGDCSGAPAPSSG